MNIEPIITILGMALVTYLTRVGGLWLVRRKTLPPAFQRSFTFMPGAILISILAPMLVRAGISEWVGSGLTIWVVRRTGSLAAGMVAGVLVVIAWRNLIPG